MVFISINLYFYRIFTVNIKLCWYSAFGTVDMCILVTCGCPMSAGGHHNWWTTGGHLNSTQLSSECRIIFFSAKRGCLHIKSAMERGVRRSRYLKAKIIFQERGRHKGGLDTNVFEFFSQREDRGFWSLGLFLS